MKFEDAVHFLGEEKYNEFLEHFGGQTVYIPKIKKRFKDNNERNAYMYESFRYGNKSYEYLAKEVELSLDYIIRIIKDESKKRKGLL